MAGCVTPPEQIPGCERPGADAADAGPVLHKVCHCCHCHRGCCTAAPRAGPWQQIHLAGWEDDVWGPWILAAWREHQHRVCRSYPKRHPLPVFCSAQTLLIPGHTSEPDGLCMRTVVTDWIWHPSALSTVLDFYPQSLLKAQWCPFFHRCWYFCDVSVIFMGPCPVNKDE